MRGARKRVIKDSKQSWEADHVVSRSNGPSAIVPVLDDKKEHAFTKQLMYGGCSGLQHTDNY